MGTLRLLACSCLLVCVALAPAAGAQTAEDIAVQNLLQAARNLYLQGLDELDPKLFWESVDTLDQLFSKYPDHPLARENYLTAVEILLKKVGGQEGYDAAQELLERYLRNYPDPKEPVTRDMHLVLVQMPYIYRHDYNAAAAELNRYYGAYREFLTPTETTKVKLAEARIRRKQGDFAGAALAYGAAELASRAQAVGGGRAPGVNLQREIRFCQAVAAAQSQQEGIHRFHPLAGVTSSQVAQARTAFRDAATELGLELGVDPGIPTDVFLFSSPEQLVALTGSSGPYVEAIDGELYVFPGNDPVALMAQIYGLAFQVRPTAEIPPVLAEGFPSIHADHDPWPVAARQARLLGDRFAPEVLLDPEHYHGLADGAALAAAFVQRIVERHGMARFGKLYGGWETRWTPGETPKSPEEFNQDPERYRQRLDLAGMGRAFRSATGEDLDRAWRDFQGELDKVADKLVAEFEARGGGLRTIKADESSPEAVLESWFKALQAGDTGTMEKLATQSLKQQLGAVFGEYREAGILEEARLWSMAIPYSERTYEVVRKTTLGPGNVQFQVAIKERGRPVRETLVAVYNEGGKWRMANPL